MKICISRDLFELVVEGISEIAPSAERVIVDLDGALDGDLNGVDVMTFSALAGVERDVLMAIGPLLGSPAFKWLQSPGAGIDHPAMAALLERGVRLSTGAGLHAEPIAQYVFAYILHWEREVAEHQAQQSQRVWQRIVSGDLTGKTLGVVGLGGIGEAVARVGHAFGMRVVAMRRTPVDSPNVDVLLTPDRLDELLTRADYVALCVPYTDATHHLIGAAQLEAMGPEAVLVNVSRGDVVDEAALIEALHSNTIRGATLDVVSQEPLPAASPLWNAANCIITPHDSGWSPRANERLAALFLENLGRYVRGEALRNEVRPPPATAS